MATATAAAAKDPLSFRIFIASPGDFNPCGLLSEEQSAFSWQRLPI